MLHRSPPGRIPVPAHYPSASVNHQPACARKKKSACSHADALLFCVLLLAAPEKDDVLLWHPPSVVAVDHQLALCDQLLDQVVLGSGVIARVIPRHPFQRDLLVEVVSGFIQYTAAGYLQ